MPREATQREIFMVATKIAIILYGYTEAEINKILSKAKQVLNDESHFEVER